MKIVGRKIIVETVKEAFDIWESPQCTDHQGGGEKSVRYAGYDYLGIDPNISPAESGVLLEFSNKGTEQFYHRLCAIYPFVQDGDPEYNTETGEHNFPEDGIVKVLDAYYKNPDDFVLGWVRSDDDLYVTVKNKKNQKTLNVSVIGDIFERYVYWTFLQIFHEEEDIKEQNEKKTGIDEFLN